MKALGDQRDLTEDEVNDLLDVYDRDADGEDDVYEWVR